MEGSLHDLARDVHHALVTEDRAGSAPAAHIVSLVRRAAPLLPNDTAHEVAGDVADRLHGLGPLDPLLRDPQVADILVNGPGPVWVERSGRLERTDVQLDTPTIQLMIERILGPLGRQVDPIRPMAEARLADGSRVQVMVPPVAVDGPCLAIRRFAARPIPLGDLAPGVAGDLLRWMIAARWNVVVVGGTGAGKTTVLNALADLVEPGERVVTVEDAAELRLPIPHVVRLETRPDTAAGTPGVSCRDLVRAALRLRPDRLIVGEVRGPEALDMVQAMSTGHDGSLSTLHANGCGDALRRLELLVLLAGSGLPHHAVRDQLASAVDSVVAVARLDDGRRVVTEIVQLPVPGAEGAEAELRRLTRGGEVLAAPTRPARSVSPPALPAGVCA